ncbi:MAG: PDZ domain-containing protein [Cyanothece sp. SIO2G6]|nr:PDZ domain-containing protein [Cyanothece sp. SIO2G6]
MRKQLVWLGGLLICLLLTVGWLVDQDAAQAYSEEQQLLSEVWRIVDRAYVDSTFNDHNWWKVRQQTLRQSLPDRSATYDAIQSMLVLLDDPFTRLLRPRQYQSLQTDTSGELTGVGLQLVQDQKTDELVVIAPIEGSPAQAAMILPRDRILAVDGVSVKGLTLDEAAERMRGSIGSLVTLTVRHVADQQQEDIDLVRDRITLNPVFAELRSPSPDLKIGYIRLSQFNANATEEVQKSIQQFESERANGYILDLRNNPGGLLQAGIEIARLWLDQGTILYTVNRYGIQDRLAATGANLTDAPLAVLINSGTASASEILSGALQDNGRATLIGETSFGKGLIQSLFNLSDGSGLAVTVARYETPDHHDINKTGIVPDVEVVMSPLNGAQLATDEDIQYQTALDVLQKTLLSKE